MREMILMQIRWNLWFPWHGLYKIMCILPENKHDFVKTVPGKSQVPLHISPRYSPFGERAPVLRNHTIQWSLYTGFSVYSARKKLTILKRSRLSCFAGGVFSVAAAHFMATDHENPSGGNETWWRHQMETVSCSALLALCVRGIHR